MNVRRLPLHQPQPKREKHVQAPRSICSNTIASLGDNRQSVHERTRQLSQSQLYNCNKNSCATVTITAQRFGAQNAQAFGVAVIRRHFVVPAAAASSVTQRQVLHKGKCYTKASVTQRQVLHKGIQV